MSTDLTDKLREYLIEDLGLDVAPEEITNDFVLLGRIDSLGLFDMVSFIEDEFGVAVTNEELIPKNFDSVGGVVQLVQSKLAVSPS
jgi:acyl carrier protein